MHFVIANPSSKSRKALKNLTVIDSVRKMLQLVVHASVVAGSL